MGFEASQMSKGQMWQESICSDFKICPLAL